jgi:hypothetical protein
MRCVCVQCVHVLIVLRMLLHLLLSSYDSFPPLFLEAAIGLLLIAASKIYIYTYIHMYAYVRVRVRERAYGAFVKYVDVFICYLICVPSVNNTVGILKLP